MHKICWCSLLFIFQRMEPWLPSRGGQSLRAVARSSDFEIKLTKFSFPLIILNRKRKIYSLYAIKNYLTLEKEGLRIFHQGGRRAPHSWTHQFIVLFFFLSSYQKFILSIMFTVANPTDKRKKIYRFKLSVFRTFLVERNLCFIL